MLGNEQLFMSFSGGEEDALETFGPDNATIVNFANSYALTFGLHQTNLAGNDSVPKFVVWPLDGIFLDLHRRE